MKRIQGALALLCEAGAETFSLAPQHLCAVQVALIDECDRREDRD